MTVHQTFLQITQTTGEMVLALHCSGGTGRQWRTLAELIGQRRIGRFPDLFGTPSAGHWAGRRPFSLAIEALPILAAIDSHDGPVHLVGHSYGGGLALHVAAMRPERISSLRLYEPTAFHVLRHAGAEGADALAEVAAVAKRIRASYENGARTEGARAFVDYWNGDGAWNAMPDELRQRVLAYMPKAAYDFEALIEEPTPLQAYERFPFPVLILHGDRSPAPAILVAKVLASVIASAITGELAGLGHMGPVTHAERVAAIIARQIDSVALPALWRAA
jgi:pimeloyl-ACP methyl ester carboxylesterase